jgi:hypothetical protein
VAHRVISKVHKIKSHMKRDQVAPDQMEWWQGNDKADWIANQALPQYIEAEETDFLKAAAQQRQRLRQVCDHLSQVEALAPMARLLRQHPRTRASKAEVQAKRQHVWEWHRERRLCQRCGLMPRRQDCRSYRGSCPGHIPGHAQVHPSHRMRMTTVPGAEVPLVFCKSCGSYGQARFAKLRKVCSGTPSTATFTMHKRLLQGRHPLSQLPLTPHVAWCPPAPRCRQPFAEAAARTRLRSSTVAIAPGSGPDPQQETEPASDPGVQEQASSDEDVFHHGFGLDED